MTTDTINPPIPDPIAADAAAKLAGLVASIFSGLAGHGGGQNRPRPRGPKTRIVPAVKAIVATALPALLQTKDCEELRRRESILAEWWRSLKGAKQTDRATRLFVKRARTRGQKITRATLYNWQRRFRQFGLAGLVDGRWLTRVAIENTADVSAKHQQGRNRL